jgi:hypothetical protein
MPSYQNLFPPISLAPGNVGFSFNHEAFPGSTQAGTQFAISSFPGQCEKGMNLESSQIISERFWWTSRPISNIMLTKKSGTLLA